MLTRCPYCQSWFRVRAEQLSIAHGRVTCGTCDRVFSALATLVDDEPAAAPRLDVNAPSTHPAPAPAIPAASESETAAAETAEGDIAESEVAESEVAEADTAEADTAEAETAEAETAEAETAEAETAEAETAEAETAEAETAEAETAARRSVDTGGAPPADDVPALLREEYAALARAQARQPRRRPWWAVACVLLGCALLVQFAVVERAALAVAVPAAAPWLERLCARLPCPPLAADGRGGVRLLARDVREHPQYEHALLVNATLVNDGATSAPFPIIELVLHDAGGRAVGARRFDPAEYLDHSMPVAAGMPPRQPVYVVIELAGPDAAATSFEFRFL